jgi:DNA (cytosine-5)-methyltransferase 1
MGYHRAGFDVVGVDINPQPRYPFEFHQGDALEYLAEHGHDFDAIHASPPCQAYTKAQRIRGNAHADLVGPTRSTLQAIGKPYVIENVMGAPLLDPIMLCGAMFDIRTYRHRIFETSWGMAQPIHPVHVAKTTKMGRKLKDGEFMHIVGNFTGAATARGIMGMPWATRDELREAIPPAYTEFIGGQLITQLEQVSA